MSKFVSLESAKKNWPILNIVKIISGAVAVNLDTISALDSLVCNIHNLPLTRIHPHDLEMVCPQGDTKVKIPQNNQRYSNIN